MEFTNSTPFVAQELYLADADGRDIVTIVVKATYLIDPKGELTLADEQVPVDMPGTYHGKPGESSARFEPEVAPLKLATDVVLVGHAWPDRSQARMVNVGFQCGPLQKVIRVYGDRRWVKHTVIATISEPQPFERIPLVYERAFGGWDRTPEDEADHTVDLRNPVGVGYHHRKRGRFVEGSPVPNLEDLREGISSYADAPSPAGFGFLGPGWSARAKYAGTYDKAWMEQRLPLLPRDFDPRFYNAAPPDQTVPGYLRGDEPVSLANASPEGRLTFRLPGEPAALCGVRTLQGPAQTQHANLDTVILDTDEYRVLLLWRACFPVHRQIHQIQAITVEPHPASRFAHERVAAAV